MSAQKVKNTFLSLFDKNKKFKLDHRLPIFLFFLGISTIFWFLNALSEEYTTTISLPVRYEYNPENKILVRDKKMPDKLSLQVKAYGFSLLRYQLSSNIIPLTIKVNSLNLKQLNQNDSLNYFFLTKNLSKNELSSPISTQIEVLKISPDSIFFQFAKSIRKKIPVEPDVSLELKNQFMLNGKITTTPDSVEIIGPNTIIDTINQFETRNIKIAEAEKTQTRKVEIKTLDNVTVNPEKVVVRIPIEEFTEIQMRLPIEVKNEPPYRSLQTFPRDVQARFLVALSDYNKVNANDFKVVVDFNEIDKNIGNKLKVSVTKKPDYCRSLELHPQNVEYIIEKND